MQSTDALAVRELFREVFKEEMSQEFWDWKYSDEMGRGAVLYKDGQLIAHYGGVGRKVLWLGEACQAIQISDVMVRPDQRRSTRKNGPFYESLTKFMGTFVGYNNQFRVAFGFPNDRVMRLAELLKLYAPVERMVEVSWSTDVPLDTGKLHMVEINRENFENYRSVIGRLWARMAACMKEHVVGICDADFIKKRYLSHPVKQYRIVLFSSRFLRRPMGIAVLREDADQMFLMDIICDLETIPSVVGQLLSLTAKSGKNRMVTWITSNSASLFEVGGGALRQLPIAVPTCIWVKNGPEVEEFRDKWWLMPGDTDFQ